MSMMKLRRRKYSLLATAALILLGATSGYAAETALDQVTVGYSPPTGKVLLLGISGADRVSLKLYAGVGASEAGAQATEGGGSGGSYAAGGRLRYTLYDQPGSKITVETEWSDYTDGALSVMALGIGTGGSGNVNNIQGSPSSPGRTGYVPIKYNVPYDFITAISGASTWTGTNRTDGVWLKYRLNAHPGGVAGSSLPVLYTILAE